MRTVDASVEDLPFRPDEVDLRSLDRAFLAALRSGRPDGLPVVGYGEISVAFSWPPQRPTVVAKSLPPFPDARRLDHYVAVLDDYLVALGQRGVETLPTAVRAIADGRRRRAYVLQPWVPPEMVGPAVLAGASPAEGLVVLERIVTAVLRASDRTLGIDGQVSNWVVDRDRVRYLDVSTPMLRDERGRDRLDTALFVDAVPWCLRWPVDRFVAPALLSPYHEPRRVILDTAGNLMRERLARWIPALLCVANPHLEPELTVDEVRRFYRGNARLWSTLQLLRRADRAWQRGIRQRQYPFPLPDAYRR
jgi:hypothetical protein